jgi:uncharacterized protein YfaS (alpha-2-macroglobulin family)
LLEAKEKAFYVPDNMISPALEYLYKQASETGLPDQVNKGTSSQFRTQAYRLYVLAIGGKANIGAMNRMRNLREIDHTSAHILAASYALIGQKEIAQEFVSGRSTNIEAYTETGGTYGSHIRDLAMINEALLALGNMDESAAMVKRISEALNSNRWHSTQTIAYSLLSVGKFLSFYEDGAIEVEINHSGEQIIEFNSSKPLLQIPLEISGIQARELTIHNKGKGVLFSKLILSGQKPPGTNEASQFAHVKLDIQYKQMNGQIMDPKRIPIGTDFIAEVKIENLNSKYYNIEEMALSQIFPSGWEILNTRLTGIGNANKDSPSDYRDYRDDRVYTFFDINGKNPYTYTVFLNASYAGKYYMPPVSLQAMYDNEVQANSNGFWVEVTTD